MARVSPYIVTLFLLVLALIGLSYLWEAPGSTETGALEEFPDTVGSWRAVTQPLQYEDYVYEVLETRDLLTRYFAGPEDESVELFIVYSGGRRRAFHPPELCFTGAGGVVADRGVEELSFTAPDGRESTLRVSKLLIEDRHGRHIVWYWFSSGTRMTENYYRQQALMLLDTVLRRPGGGSMVRLLRTYHDPADREAEEQKVREFALDLAPVFYEFLQGL